MSFGRLPTDGHRWIAAWPTPCVRVCIAAFVVLIVLVTTLILIRFAPLFSLGWADEIVEMAFAWMTFLGAAALWRSRSHFRVDLLPGTCWPARGRGRSWRSA